MAGPDIVSFPPAAPTAAHETGLRGSRASVTCLTWATRDVKLGHI
jgi:hypothetical protein